MRKHSARLISSLRARSRQLTGEKFAALPVPVARGLSSFALRANERRVAPCRFARLGDQGFAFIAELKIRVGPLRGVHGTRPAPVPGERGFASFTLRVNEVLCPLSMGSAVGQSRLTN